MLLRLIPFAIVLTVLLHQLGATVGGEAHGTPNAQATAQIIEEHHGGCSGYPTQARVCPALPAFLHRLPLAPLLIILLGVSVASPFPWVVRLFAVDWQWPPNKRRALLQVFLR